MPTMRSMRRQLQSFLLEVLLAIALILFLSRAVTLTERCNAQPDGFQLEDPIPPRGYVPHESGNIKFAFDVDDSEQISRFQFIQFARLNGSPYFGRKIGMRGKVLVDNAPDDSPTVTVNIAIATSHKALANSIRISKNSSSTVVLETDAISGQPYACKPWIHVLTTIHVHPNANLSFCGISTDSLAIGTASMQFTVGRLLLKSVSGNIQHWLAALTAKTIETMSEHGKVTGQLPLADHISMKTVTGEVTVELIRTVVGEINERNSHWFRVCRPHSVGCVEPEDEDF